MRVLIIEDEEKTAASLRKGLTEAAFEVTVARRGDEGLLLARTQDYQVIELDVMLPRRTGWEILQHLRESGNPTPVLCLTARDAIEDRVRGLELGADDYLVKPFAFAELVARIRNLLRRRPAEDSGMLAVADLELDLVRQRAVRRGELLDLTPREFALLSFFAKYYGEVLSRSLIASEVWAMTLDSDSNVIDVAVRRLRLKVDTPFPQELIHTVRGVGYVLEAR
jgi:two-component system, OmpR family, copper resistance phosphate regulon response regulator CusR